MNWYVVVFLVRLGGEMWVVSSSLSDQSSGGSSLSRELLEDNLLLLLRRGVDSSLDLMFRFALLGLFAC